MSSTGEPLAGVNGLTTSACCPTSKQPELKHAAVKILKAEMPWPLLGMAWLPENEALQAREELRRLMTRFPFAACVPFGRERTGVLLRAASYEAPSEELLGRIEALLGLAGPDALRYADRKKGQRRTARLVRNGDEARLEGFLLAGDIRAQTWIKALLQDQLPAQSYGRLLLLPGAKAPVALRARSKQVCACFNVAENDIANHLAGRDGSDAARLSALQADLKCGTQCGSCLPELKRLARAVQPVHAAGAALANSRKS